MQHNGNFYKTKKWEEVRKRILRRDRYTDQLDLRNGIHTPADLVHHIFPSDVYPEYRYKEWNLISLSRDNHELLHNRVTNDLTNAGRALLMETASAQGIKLDHLTLIVGLKGTGKTEWVKQHLGNGVAYDLDYIASAFRLKAPHEEYHKTSRKMANSMGRAFAEKARSYGGDIFIIRTAPTIEELVAYNPDTIVVCKDKHNIDHRRSNLTYDETEKLQRILAIEEYCKANGLDVVTP